MPARRKSMRKTKEVLRLRFELGLGQWQIAHSCGMGLGTVHDYLGAGGSGRDRLAVARGRAASAPNPRREEPGLA